MFEQAFRNIDDVLRKAELRYNNAIADAVAELGKPEEIGTVFSGFQKYLYRVAAASSTSSQPPQ